MRISLPCLLGCQYSFQYRRLDDGRYLRLLLQPVFWLPFRHAGGFLLWMINKIIVSCRHLGESGPNKNAHS
ncbi:conserved hypothetical protein [Aeromonas salmonicida]|nr:conserved hypothetical protein [Aeromonas salmonicida]